MPPACDYTPLKTALIQVVIMMISVKPMSNQ